MRSIYLNKILRFLILGISFLVITNGCTNNEKRKKTPEPDDIQKVNMDSAFDSQRLNDRNLFAFFDRIQFEEAIKKITLYQSGNKQILLADFKQMIKELQTTNYEEKRRDYLNYRLSFPKNFHYSIKNKKEREEDLLKKDNSTRHLTEKEIQELINHIEKNKKLETIQESDILHSYLYWKAAAGFYQKIWYQIENFELSEYYFQYLYDKCEAFHEIYLYDQEVESTGIDKVGDENPKFLITASAAKNILNCIKDDSAIAKIRTKDVDLFNNFLKRTAKDELIGFHIIFD